MSDWEPIEGETPVDLSYLKDKSIRTRAELNRREAHNISKAVLKYFAAKPYRTYARFDFSWGLKLHAEMFGDVWEWAGEIRNFNTNIGVPWTQISQRLFDLFGDLAFWEEQQTMPLLEQAVHLHHRAVQIHPFPDGNGRWSRLLANIWLKLHDHPITAWPTETAGTQSLIRAEYLLAVKQADDGKISDLMQLHKRYTKAEEG